MKGFNRFYLWGRDMKYRMGLYTVTVICYKVIINALYGVFSVDSLCLVEMLLASFAFACAETVIFPAGKEWGAISWRTVLWAALANGIYIGAAILFGWFRGIPTWGGALLIGILQIILVAIWYALWLEARQDTKNLNQSLKKYQSE